VISPFEGSTLPMCAARFAAYQGMPLASTITVCGPAPAARSKRRNASLSGSKRAT
jgi:hypothetical protein